MSELIQILYLDGSPEDRKVVLKILEETGGFVTTLITSQSDFVPQLNNRDFDLLLCDFNVPGLEGFKVLDAAHSNKPNLPVVILTGKDSEEKAIKALKIGALDYELKSSGHIHHLPQIIRHILAYSKLEKEHQQAMQALQESEGRFQSAFELAPIGMLMITRDGKFLKANHSFCKMLGYSESEILSKNIYQITFAEDILLSQNQIEQSIKKGQETNQFIKRYIHKDGHLIWVSISSSLVCNSANEPLYFISQIQDINESKKNEEKLEEERTLLQALLNYLPDGIYFKDLKSRFIRINQSQANHLGRTDPSHLLGKTDFDFFNEQHARQAYEDEQKIIQTGQAIINKEEEETWPDGQKAWASTTKMPLRDKSGQIIGTFGLSRDISERKKAEEMLRESEERFKSFFDNITDVILLTAPDGRIFATNPATYQLFGWTEEELIKGGRNLLVDIHDARVASAIKERADTGKTQVELEFMKKDGSRFAGELTSAVYLDKDCNEKSFMMIRDITERKQAEEALFQSRQMLQLVMDNIPMLVFWKDCNLVYLGCNTVCAVEANLANSREIVGKTDFDLPWKDLANNYLKDDLQVLEKGIPLINLEESFVQPDGSVNWVRFNKVPLHDRDGNVIGLLGTSEDITEHKKAEQEIENANKKLISWVNDLEKRNKEANLLRQMGDLLQACNEYGEYYAIITEYAHHLFPNTNGALLIINNSRHSVEAMTIWGEHLQSKNYFKMEECWALRRGQVYTVKSHTPGLICRHMLKPFTGSYLDIPMVASGETIGVLHIEGPEDEKFLSNIKELALTVADHISLSLSNLKLREKLRFQAIRDVLTGLYNRRYMEESLARELPRAVRKNSQIGILMLDIDHFKIFNDTYGHDAGDVVLHELGAILQSQIRGEDISCRFGGEEFILILPEANLKCTLQRAETIRKKIKSMNVEYHNQSLGVTTVSIGVAIFPLHSTTAEGILKKADEALYQAKHNGRDRVEVAADPQ